MNQCIYSCDVLLQLCLVSILGFILYCINYLPDERSSKQFIVKVSLHACWKKIVMSCTVSHVWVSAVSREQCSAMCCNCCRRVNRVERDPWVLQGSWAEPDVVNMQCRGMLPWGDFCLIYSSQLHCFQAIWDHSAHNNTNIIWEKTWYWDVQSINLLYLSPCNNNLHIKDS